MVSNLVSIFNDCNLVVDLWQIKLRLRKIKMSLINSSLIDVYNYQPEFKENLLSLNEHNFLAVVSKIKFCSFTKTMIWKGNKKKTNPEGFICKLGEKMYSQHNCQLLKRLKYSVKYSAHLFKMQTDLDVRNFKFVYNIIFKFKLVAQSLHRKNLSLIFKKSAQCII